MSHRPAVHGTCERFGNLQYSISQSKSGQINPSFYANRYSKLQMIQNQITGKYSWLIKKSIQQRKWVSKNIYFYLNKMNHKLCLCISAKYTLFYWQCISAKYTLFLYWLCIFTYCSQKRWKDCFCIKIFCLFLYYSSSVLSIIQLYYSLKNVVHSHYFWKYQVLLQT